MHGNQDWALLNLFLVEAEADFWPEMQSLQWRVANQICVCNHVRLFTKNIVNIKILNYILSFIVIILSSLWLFVFLSGSLWSNVWRVSSRKSHCLCLNSKVALTHSHSATKVRYNCKDIFTKRVLHFCLWLGVGLSAGSTFNWAGSSFFRRHSIEWWRKMQSNSYALQIPVGGVLLKPSATKRVRQVIMFEALTGFSHLHPPLGKPVYTKTDEFPENFRKGGGG